MPPLTLIFIAVGTPTRRGDGYADLKYVYAAAEEIAGYLQGYTVIVDKSTVPVGTAREVQRIIRKTNPDAEFDVASNPEFLREGSAITDFMRPDRVVLGVESKRAEALLRELYRPLNLIEAPILVTDLESAEITKYAANAFLATKISFINEISQLCEKTGADVHAVARGMGLDGRIGRKFLHAGPGYGGSCFPKDTVALIRMAQEHGVSSRIVESVVEVNASQKARMVSKIKEALGGIGGGQDHCRAGPHLQAGNRRYARCALPGDTAGAGGPRRHHPRPRPRGHGRSKTPPARGHPVRGLHRRGGRGCRCRGTDDRVEPVPRAGPGQAQVRMRGECSWICATSTSAA